ncbi:MAG: hypothetical protein JKX97_01235 [Candidatus Lindowbacteria bacterium]|nr:hypothetical protein [Candidatus Lindowbacteria bacterium]
MKPFSSRTRLLVYSVCAALLFAASIFSIQEFYVIPEFEEKIASRRSEIPAFLAVSNQRAIITKDLVSLKKTLQQSIRSLEASGVQYAIIQNTDGDVIAQASHREWAPKQMDIVKIYLSTVYQNANNAGTQDFEAVMAEVWDAEDKAKKVEVKLPPVQEHAVLEIDLGNMNVIDEALPISRGSVNFGAIRVGIKDELPSIRSTTRVAGGIISVIIAVVFILSAFFLSSDIDSNFSESTTMRIDAIRNETEKKLRNYELARTQKEDASPISATEYLSVLDFARTIGTTIDYNQVLELSMEACAALMGVRDVSILLVDASSGDLVGRIGKDEEGYHGEDEMSRVRVPLGSGEIGAAAEFGTTAMINNPKPGSAVVSALVCRGRTLGVIIVRSKLSNRSFAKKDQTMVRLFSAILANGMENGAMIHH